SADGTPAPPRFPSFPQIGIRRTSVKLTQAFLRGALERPPLAPDRRGHARRVQHARGERDVPHQALPVVLRTGGTPFESRGRRFQSEVLRVGKIGASRP